MMRAVTDGLDVHYSQLGIALYLNISVIYLRADLGTQINHVAQSCWDHNIYDCSLRNPHVSISSHSI